MFGFTSRVITAAWGTSSDSRRHLGYHKAGAREVTARACETGDQAEPDRVGDGSEDDRDRRGCVARRLCGGDAARSYYHVDLTGSEIGCQRRQSIVVALSPAVFNRYVLSLDTASFAESLAKSGHIGCRLTR